MVCRNSLAFLGSHVKKGKSLTWLLGSFRRLLTKGNIRDEEFIKNRTILSNDHLTPEIGLHLITPKCKLWRARPEESEFENDPFWAIYWPGGQALSRFILDHKHLFEKKNVLDIGSGSGACAIAAAKSNSAVVLANDIDEVSLTAIKLNARLNEVDILVEGDDIIGQDIDLLRISRNGFVFTPKWDIVLIGDLFYDSEFAKKLFLWLCQLALNGKLVLIGDPGRYALRDILHTGKLIKIAEYPVAKDEHYGFSQASVWQVINSENQSSQCYDHLPKKLC